MSRINFHSLTVEPRRRFTRTFEDARLPEPLTLTLLEPDALTDYAAAEISAELAKRYLTGDEALGMAPQPFMVGGEARPLSLRLCDHAALVVAMQPEEADAYQPEEILQMAFKLPALWRQVRGWALELDRGAEAALPNDWGPPEGSLSNPPSNEAVSIPEWSPGSRIPSGASASGWMTPPDR